MDDAGSSLGSSLGSKTATMKKARETVEKCVQLVSKSRAVNLKSGAISRTAQRACFLRARSAYSRALASPRMSRRRAKRRERVAPHLRAPVRGTAPAAATAARRLVLHRR
eukprot:6180674-Pleurochrysis_carterae.AAC.3